MSSLDSPSTHVNDTEEENVAEEEAFLSEEAESHVSFCCKIIRHNCSIKFCKLNFTSGCSYIIANLIKRSGSSYPCHVFLPRHLTFSCKVGMGVK
jgi:hypothetical protein